MRVAEELAYWVAFNRVAGIGAMRVQRLTAAFGTLAQAWVAPAAALADAGLDERASQAILHWRREIDPERELARVRQAGLGVLTLNDAAYPRLLREVSQPPPLLYFRGALDAADEWALAVVGTRRPTVYGRDVAERLAGELTQAGITVVSGLAKGIDSHAHRGALAAGGRTIAVLGNGLDFIYPPENRTLAAQIADSGALLSEYALGTQPAAENFPPRNRIISGLCLASVVVEAPEASGALITAGFAGEQGRDVFAVPGPVTSPASVGCHRLIQDGAKLVQSAQDILDELNLHMVPQQRQMQMLLPESEAEAQLLAQLGDLSGQPMHVDELSRATGLPVHEVTGTLAMLELKGLVRHLGGMLYALAH